MFRRDVGPTGRLAAGSSACLPARLPSSSSTPRYSSWRARSSIMGTIALLVLGPVAGHRTGERTTGGARPRRRRADRYRAPVTNGDAGAPSRPGHEPRTRRAAGADLAAHRHCRGDGRGPPAGRLQPQHQGAGRLLGGTVHAVGRVAGAGRAHPRPPGFDAGERRAPPSRRSATASARASRWCSTIPSPAEPTSTTSPWWRRAWSTASWWDGRRTGRTTPTWAARRRGRSRPTPPRSIRRACASRPPASTRPCGGCCSPTRARRPSGSVTSTPRWAPTWSASSALRPWPAGMTPWPRWSTTASGACGRRWRRCPTAPGGRRTCLDSTGAAPEQQRPARVAVSVTVTGDEVAFDFTGSDPQARGNVNAVEAVTVSAVSYALRAAVDPIHPRQRRGAAAGAGRGAGRHDRRRPPTRGRRRRQRRGEPAGGRRVPAGAGRALPGPGARGGPGDDEQPADRRGRLGLLRDGGRRSGRPPARPGHEWRSHGDDQHQEYADRGAGAHLPVAGAALPAAAGEWRCWSGAGGRGHRAGPAGAGGLHGVAHHRTPGVAAVGSVGR